jgi:hypothetical protein
MTALSLFLFMILLKVVLNAITLTPYLLQRLLHNYLIHDYNKKHHIEFLFKTMIALNKFLFNSNTMTVPQAILI